MDKKYLTRQLDLINVARLDTPIVIIGAGAVGSFTTLSLAKMGFNNLLVFDDDKIDAVNMNCQFYRPSDIGKPKVRALYELVKDFTGIDISFEQARISKERPFAGIVIICVDSMKARKDIWQSYRDGQSMITTFYVDSRMSAENALLYSFDPRDIDRCANYDASLYSDEEAVRERCTAKSTMYTVLALSSQICAAVKNYIMDQEIPAYLAWDINKFDFVSFKSPNPRSNNESVSIAN